MLLRIDSVPPPIKEQAKAPDGEGCPRCGVFVYAAEKMMGREKVKLIADLLLSHNQSYINS